jgi:hypothetical protein
MDTAATTAPGKALELAARIEVESDVGHGSRFRLIFPGAGAAPPPPPSPGAAVSPPAA